MVEKKKITAKKIGVDVKAPTKTCDDKNCPFHGSLSVRGKTFVGTVLKAVMDKTVVVGWDRRTYNKKYERYEKSRTKIKAHNSPCIEVKAGDIVKIMETRPLSKTVNFVVIDVMKNAEEGEQ
jgi:small subunit ribosomal protein S17